MSTGYSVVTRDMKCRTVMLVVDTSRWQGSLHDGWTNKAMHMSSCLALNTTLLLPAMYAPVSSSHVSCQSTAVWGRETCVACRATALQHAGLAKLVQMVLGYSLDKSQQLSNWGFRPLRAEQIQYAAADAHCLTALFDALVQQAPALLQGDWRHNLSRYDAGLTSLAHARQHVLEQPGMQQENGNASAVDGPPSQPREGAGRKVCHVEPTMG